jgi:NTE family protein
MDIPEKERALVLQGGGSLGAYEAGAYRALYDGLSKKDANERKKGKSTFDIVAGTSIGAINAAVLVSYSWRIEPMKDLRRDLLISGTIFLKNQ